MFGEGIACWDERDGARGAGEIDGARNLYRKRIPDLGRRGLGAYCLAPYIKGGCTAALGAGQVSGDTYGWRRKSGSSRRRFDLKIAWA